MGGPSVSMLGFKPSCYRSGEFSASCSGVSSNESVQLIKVARGPPVCSTMDESSNCSGFSPELKDLETKLGRKVPDGLVRSLLAGGKRTDKSPHFTNCKLCEDSTGWERLQSKMLLLRQEMVSFSQVRV